jgi:hypothetical protein
VLPSPSGDLLLMLALVEPEELTVEDDLGAAGILHCFGA